MPLLPSGIRLMHLATFGLFLAVLAPLLLLAFIVKRDPRVRASQQIERDAGLPVLGAIPVHLNREKEAEASRRRTLATAIFVTVAVIYVLVLFAKWMAAS